MLGGLSVPLNWGVAVPPDDYDHWAPKPEPTPDTVDAAEALAPTGAADANQWNECKRREEEVEPHFELPRSSGVIPHSPAAG